MRLTEQEYQQIINRKHDPLKLPAAAKGSKFHNHLTELDNIKFHSQKEANYYAELVMRQKAGEVKFFLRQVPIHLPGKTKYIVDFIEFGHDGSMRFIDVKGHKTDVYKMKKRQVEELYPIRIIEV